MSNGKWFNNIARLIKNPNNGNYFIEFGRPKKQDGSRVGDNPFPLTINEGDTFSARPKKADLKRLVDEGTLSQETADKICERVKFEFSIPPKDGKSPSKTGSDDEVNW